MKLAVMISVFVFAAIAQHSQPASHSSNATLDRMVAAGKSRQDLAKHVFDMHGCKSCHTLGQNGKLGFTERGNQIAKGFEGCIAMLTAMNVIAQVAPDQRTQRQRKTAARFQEFGCTTCHQIVPGKMGLTELGSRLAHLHLGCVDVEKQLAQSTPKR
jgi:hypothetical protein